jgi:hypothetical protein
MSSTKFWLEEVAISLREMISGAAYSYRYCFCHGTTRKCTEERDGGKFLSELEVGDGVGVKDGDAGADGDLLRAAHSSGWIGKDTSTWIVL